MYQKSMRDALQEAREYRDPKQTEVSEGHLSYDEWLKQEKGIAKGAHGINSDEHAKYSKEWKSYATDSESNLKEIVGGQGEMTITQDDKVLIIKTKDWQTYKAKGWVKKTNESLDLSTTGATTASSTSQEVEGEELSEGFYEKAFVKSLEDMRQAFEKMKRSGLSNEWQKRFEKEYDWLVYAHFGTKYAHRAGIKRADTGKVYTDDSR